MDIYYSGVGLLFHDDVATPMIKSTPAVIFNSGLTCSVRGYFFPAEIYNKKVVGLSLRSIPSLAV